MSTLVGVRETGDRRRVVVFGVALVVAAGVSLWALSFPGLPFSWAGLSLLIWGVGLVGGVSIAAAKTGVVRRIVPAAAVLAAAGVVGASAVAVPPMPMRFVASAAAFQEVVSRAGPLDPAFAPSLIATSGLAPGEADDPEAGTFGPFPADCPRRIGSYAIADCRTFADGYLFLLRESAVTDDAGFAYLPHGLPVARTAGRGLGPDGFTHLDGAWYAWVCRC